MRVIDEFLNDITMYRLVLYFLVLFVLAGFVFSLFGILPFNPINLGLSLAIILSFSWITNTLFAKVFEAPTNIESVYITALILALIVAPATNFQDVINTIWIAALAMASKYILAIKKKHVFNPAAISAFLVSTFAGGKVSWWVGSSVMLPMVLICGFLIVRKIKRFDLLLSFVAVSLITIEVFSLGNGADFFNTLYKALADSPLIFFATIMLTEPLTTPPTRTLRVFYAAFVGFLFSPQIHIGSFYTTPELALLFGNIYSYAVSAKDKLVLSVSQKIKIAPNIYDFIFDLPYKLKYNPGQYMEWTLAHEKTDSRGSRRYFTLASSPTEDNLRIGVKFNEFGSSYKESLQKIDGKTKIVATDLNGEFTLPDDTNKKLVFVAGGIGVTPFRSMIKYVSDKNEKRDIILLYSAKEISEFVYGDVFAEAKKKFGLRYYYFSSSTEPSGSSVIKGRVTAEFIEKNIPDFKDRYFYLSGPWSMVKAYERLLGSLSVPRSHIRTDYFPGFA